MKFYSSTFVALFHGTGRAWGSYLLQIWALEDHLDVFLLYTDGTILYRWGNKNLGSWP